MPSKKPTTVPPHTADTRWNFFLNLDRTPTCPGCGTYLINRLVRFYHGFAVCPRFELEAAGNCNDTLPLMLLDELRQHFVCKLGLRFYMPDTSPPLSIVDFRESLRQERVADATESPRNYDPAYDPPPDLTNPRFLRRLHSVANVPINPPE